MNDFISQMNFRINNFEKHFDNDQGQKEIFNAFNKAIEECMLMHSVWKIKQDSYWSSK